MCNPDTLHRRSLVLAADDEVVSRTPVRKSLEQVGFKVVEAEDGSKALQTFKETSPELVVMHSEMPDMDGIEACAALRRLRRGQGTPVLMVTGRDDVESLQRAFEAGATDFLARPIDRSLLAYRVRDLPRASRTYRAPKAAEPDLIKRRQVEARIRSLAYYGGLTRLPNRRLFTEHIAQTLRQARRTRGHTRCCFSISIILKRATTTWGIAGEINCCDKSLSGFPAVCGRVTCYPGWVSKPPRPLVPLRR